jgi:hypothetical protein
MFDKDNYNECELIDGTICQYDAATHSIDFLDPRYFDFIGCGRIHSVNGYPQTKIPMFCENPKNLLYFWKRNANFGLPEKVKNKTGKLTEFVLGEEESNGIYIWTDKGKTNIIKNIEGVANVWVAQYDCQYHIVFDPRYNRNVVMENIKIAPLKAK